MRRRQFVFSAATFALLSGCQALPNIRLAGQVWSGPRRYSAGTRQGANNDSIAGLKQGLAELGYVEGQNITFELRDSDGWDQQLSSLANESAQANELVRLAVDLIVALESAPTHAAQQATTAIPVVFVAVTDPVGQGLVANLAHPGGNLTGFTNTPATVLGKTLQLLDQLVPGLSRVALITNLSLASAPFANPSAHDCG